MLYLLGVYERSGVDAAELAEGYFLNFVGFVWCFFFFFSSRRRHTRSLCDWSSDVCSSDLNLMQAKVLKNFEVSPTAIFKSMRR